MEVREPLERYARNKEQAAFAEVVGRHGDWVYSSARRQLGDEHLAEDVTQAVFLLLAEKAGTAARCGSVGGWLFNTLRYCVKHARLERQRRERREREAAKMRPEIMEREAGWEEISPVLDEAVAQLPAKDREAILGRFYERQGYAEMGQALGVSEKAATKRVERAVAKLRGVLAKKGVIAGVGALGVVMAERVTEAAPVGLMKAVAASGGVGGAGSAGVIVKGAIRMMAWARIKAAAAILVPLLAVGAWAVWHASPGAAASASSHRPVAAGSTATTPPAIPAPDFKAAITTLSRQVNFVLAMTADRQGNLYVGTEGLGLYRFDAAAKAWRQYVADTSGLGDDNITALLTDGVGRVWAGHTTKGVSVFNGATWRNYDTITGPLGGHVWAMALCPTDSSVWIATDVGLARYTPKDDAWSYYTRAEGVPTDEFSSLAFGPDGTLYAGSQCQGIAIAGPRDNYRSWKLVQGPAVMPNTPAGEGLPSNLVNCVLVSSRGTIYAGTTCGLAWSTDQGASWRFVRGRDWEANVNGRYKGKPPEGDGALAILAEDWVTALAEDAAGNIVVGNYRGACQTLNASVSTVIDRAASRSQHPVKFIQCLPDGGSPALGTYGAGVRLYRTGGAAGGTPVMLARASPDAIHPSPAGAPGVEQLRAMLARVEALPAAQGVAGFLGDDWMTQGDWICRYGRQRGVLCGAVNPPDHDYGYGEAYDLAAAAGPHRKSSYRGAWSWQQADQGANPRWLWDPCVDTRRIGQWNDGSFDQDQYPPSWEGPDLWLEVQVPAGVHRVSLYFLNGDGHDAGSQQHRDFELELKAYTRDMDQAIAAPPMAQTRVHDFWDGVYKQFVVSEGKYWIHIRRNGSRVAIISAVLFDRLQGPASPFDNLPRVGMGSSLYGPPIVGAEKLTGPDDKSTQLIAAGAALMTGLDHAYSKAGGIDVQRPYRILALRAAAAANAQVGLLGNWRWSLPLWTAEDHEEFDAAMQEARTSLAGKLPELEQQVTKRRRTAEYQESTSR